MYVWQAVCELPGLSVFTVIGPLLSAFNSHSSGGTRKECEAKCKSTSECIWSNQANWSHLNSTEVADNITGDYEPKDGK